MPEQLNFPLTSRPALERDDFFVSPSNAIAVALIDAPHSWPAGRLILTGPPGCGKTHLTHVWAAQTGGQIVHSSALAGADIPTLAAHPVALEDADRGAGDPAFETALFHLHNLIAANGHALLVTARTPPARWGVTLPDLASRLGAIQHAALEPPDDDLLGAVIMKLLADRQLRPAPDVVPYLVRRIDRSFEAALAIIDALDDAALTQNRPITRALAAQVLDKLGAAPA